MFKSAIAAAIVALALAAGIASADRQSPRACFPAGKWDADQGKRPCAKIVRVYEDGSVRVAVSDASGKLRYRAGVGAKDR